jgi:glycosyltransferase involved in cell wall biosynthesis
MGYTLRDFMPRSSALAGIEALFTRLGKVDGVWVPAFRQKDFFAARRYATAHHIPLIFDPLISAWDKAIFEREKFKATDRKAKKLLQWEQAMFSQADLLVADTVPHAQFFIETLHAPEHATAVIPVGAEEPLFSLQSTHEPGLPPEIFFFGSFIHLQGPEVIIEAALQLPAARWTLLGNGPLRKLCEQKCVGHNHINFEDWCPYKKLPERIGKADILLGIFGSSPKASRVIPNKVYQALACGRPLITRQSAAYPKQLDDDAKSGITFIPAGDPEALANAVKALLSRPDLLARRGMQARQSYEKWFSESHIREAVARALARVGMNMA